MSGTQAVSVHHPRQSRQRFAHQAAIIIQSQLKALGITVHIRTVEWAAFIKEFVNKGRFDAIILAWTITLDPDIL